MRYEPTEKTEPAPLEPQLETAEETKLLSRLSRMLAEMKITTILRFYRLASLVLSSLLLILFPGNFSTVALVSLIFLLYCGSLLMIVLYEYYWKKIRVMFALIIIELIGISLLLAFTGGFHGPFLWFALNPFIVATAFFPFMLAWVLLAIFIAATYGFKLLIFADLYTASELFLKNYYSALNLIVIVLIMHLFARMHMSLSEQSEEKKAQRQQLLAAYQSLSTNYEIFKGLSNFQRQAVSYKNQKGIYLTLIEALIALFPFRQAVILIPPPDYRQSAGENSIPFQIISQDHKEGSAEHQLTLGEIKMRWAEFSRMRGRKLLIGENRQWIAVPLHGEHKAIRAAFVGWIKPRTNPLSFAENLSLFINFAEQTTEWLSMFKQKERVLQHIASIYEAVEAASSRNSPRTVIDLFASYARALTDCDKTIFWMENTGGGDYDQYNPIYAVKGPRELYPEEEWQETLLKVWTDIHEYEKPVVVELNPENGNRAQLIGVPVKTGSACLGMLAGIQSSNTYNTQEIIQTLTILADLGAIAVERSRIEAFAEKLLVIDEQKRIANEIHDTISQNLFSIVYSIDALARELKETLGEKAQRSLTDVKNLSAETARDLRALIYRLNPRQETNESFVLEVSNYLDQVARMNHIQINHSIEGDTEYLNPAMCRNLYRILKESTGNAIRHGKCSEIMVHLEITPFYSTLKVSDNGDGFDALNSLDLYASGDRLGLVNMRELAIALKGNLDIKSKPGIGTEVTCSIPTSPVSVQ